MYDEIIKYLSIFPKFIAIREYVKIRNISNKLREISIFTRDEQIESLIIYYRQEMMKYLKILNYREIYENMSVYDLILFLDNKFTFSLITIKRFFAHTYRNCGRSVENVVKYFKKIRLFHLLQQ